MRLLPFCAVLALSLVSVPAFAEGQVSSRDTARASSPRRPGLTVYSSGEYYSGKVNDVSVMRAFGTIGVEAHYFAPLHLYGYFRAGRTRFSYNGRLTDGLNADLQIHSVFDGSIGGGMRYRLLERPMVTLDGFLEAEGAPWNVAMKIDRLRLTTDQGHFGIRRYAQDHAKFDFSWYRLAFGTTLALHFGWFHPALTLGVQRYQAAIDVTLDQDANDLFNTLNYDPRKLQGRYRLDLLTPVVAPGMTFTIGRSFAIRAGGMFMPTGGGVVYGANLTAAASF